MLANVHHLFFSLPFVNAAPQWCSNVAFTNSRAVPILRNGGKPRFLIES
jgi:hypothetical protein